ncbi:WecB/TagA/CpsF family glycosyltransferase [Candidatus Parcubacteria bacterium]|nr:WecB/TagA/CpsF family glycosyltransferase [Patescibacteria group bacterium]MBU4309044.1 WecB/TagA/CpsF family glycosyltransferase [Patescibacteria group bacterium]MBU4431957.1 WecB/TagA/CpsF family glycosyltransferase [Patescibacteria group bacterium]MBU4577405.1 WecB/TagA/CpsF family glycosyltransferase [Patescibacteria group bacterium]MCG2697093.1 WecB/TagA/CpsF family glycosyltransferase [Candidatus Parcubacteria bacterium]
MKILGIHVTDDSREEVLGRIEGFLESDRQNIVVTPNPEIILAAQDDEKLFHILNIASLSLADGIGLKLMGLLLGENVVRITGADLVVDILKMAQSRKSNVGIINWSGGLSSFGEIKKTLEEKFVGIKVFVTDIAEKDFNNKNISFVSLSNCEIILANLGAPYQEKIIFNNLPQFPKARVLIGIGGALDFLTGKIARAPFILRKIGMEWLWRLIKQPTRIKRIINAVIVFPLRFFKFHFINCFFYRPNVACLLYKKSESGYSFLLISRSDIEHHWQVPQGGLDGLNAEEAAKKELSEELGTDKFVTKAIVKNIYRYKYVDKKTVVKHRGYKGQKQDLYIAEFIGNDEDIKVKTWEHAGWQWVSENEFISSLHQDRRKSGELFLDKFQKLTK